MKLIERSHLFYVSDVLPPPSCRWQRKITRGAAAKIAIPLREQGAASELRNCKKTDLRGSVQRKGLLSRRISAGAEILWCHKLVAMSRKCGLIAT